MNALPTGIKLSLLGFNPIAHVFDHIGIFAAQAMQFHQLLGHITPTNSDHSSGFFAQLAHARRNGRLQNLLALPHHPVRQSLLKMRQLASAQQCLIARDFSHQAFLSRHSNHLRLWQAKDVCRIFALAIHRVPNLIRR